MAKAATARPSSRPAATSLGYCTPASTREVAASSACAASAVDSCGNRCASTAAAAPAATACSDGYDGLGGAATSVVSDRSTSLGRGRLYAYFESQAATAAS